MRWQVDFFQNHVIVSFLASHDSRSTCLRRLWLQYTFQPSHCRSSLHKDAHCSVSCHFIVCVLQQLSSSYSLGPLLRLIHDPICRANVRTIPLAEEKLPTMRAWVSKPLENGSKMLSSAYPTSIRETLAQEPHPAFAPASLRGPHPINPSALFVRTSSRMQNVPTTLMKRKKAEWIVSSFQMALATLSVSFTDVSIVSSGKSVFYLRRNQALKNWQSCWITPPSYRNPVSIPM